MFVDASALAAILLNEEGAEELTKRIEAEDFKLTSPLAIYETTLAVTRVHRRDVADAEISVRTLLRRAGIAVHPVDDDVASLAIQAHATFGKGQHPAKLNLCDCFSYAMAKRHRVPLLYKGDDFALTDLA